MALSLDEMLREFIELANRRKESTVSVGYSGIELATEVREPELLGAHMVYAIGRDTMLGDPIVLGFGEPGAIHYLENGDQEGAIQVADSIAGFFRALDLLQDAARDREDPVRYAKKPPDLSTIERFVEAIERLNPGSESRFWRDLLEQEWARE